MPAHSITDDLIPDTSDVKYESLPMLSVVLAVDNTKSEAERFTFSNNAQPNNVLVDLTNSGLLYGDIEELFDAYFPKYYINEGRITKSYLHIAVMQHKQSTQNYLDFLMRNALITALPQYNIYETTKPGYYDISLLFATKEDRDAFAENRAAWFVTAIQ